MIDASLWRAGLARVKQGWLDDVVVANKYGHPQKFTGLVLASLSIELRRLF
ncbi:hypothetical protein RIF25_15385 [Thermosynechococcaceae cyanobacterium BACA0444]|uniref:Uncharacterized protein n=1 Tax=Pseudocalidococcus azoricus BACA0444 TaxID=2918990 RepID=A0AAE4JZJ1_9CYAN|nr:hypothetical protein [Pseudocalidococcus azoricus]MDS3862184.1 hypothetical protein [Pseudocalidococcus azoricus BACA0444]